MNITEDIIQAIYTRANEYAVIKFGGEPDRIELYEDGTINARYFSYHCGQQDEESYTITAEMLTEDLEVVAAQRKLELENKRIEQLKQQKERELQQTRIDKQRRKEQYEKLKKEFE